MTVLEKLKQGFTFLDGAMGTELQKRGLKAGELPEGWSVDHPEAVTDIHLSYLRAGSDVILTNTFGANSLKFGDGLEKVVAASIGCAKKAVELYGDKRPTFVALDIGPLGKLLKPLGDLDFEAAVEIFAKTVRLGVKHGVDLIVVETMNDCYETKAAVLAAKENSELPVFVTNVYDSDGKLMTGADPEAMVAMLEGLRVDAVGLNCSLGPNEMLPIIKRLYAACSIPVIAKPNAGLPVVVNGKTHFDVTPKQFAENMLELAESGAVILGGCCGTDPEYIAALTKALKGRSALPCTKKEATVISSYTHAVPFFEKPVLIGERINPTGKKRFKQALVERDIPYILNEGIRQADLGVDALDVNVGLPEIDEVALLKDTVTALQGVTDLPLQLDTALPEAMESALRIYNGKPLINSVNGKKESMQSIFPLCAKYGGVVVALTLDEGGIPTTAEKRVEIALKIIKEAENYGIDKRDIIIDPLAMAVSSDKNAAAQTLLALKLLKDMGIKTVLGVSNVSFGLPCRDIVTSAYFTMALQNGLSAAIMNPYSAEMTRAYKTHMLLSGLDEACAEYIRFTEGYSLADGGITAPTEAKRSSSKGVFDAIVKGLKEDAAAFTAELLKDTEPLTVINEHIIPALDEVGRGFEAKTTYLPQLLMSAEAATCAFNEVKAKMPVAVSDSQQKIVIATVKGDIHDIGKNIVRVLLENYGFRVIDLGKDVPPETVLRVAADEGAGLVGLSALMTTTVPAMAETVKLIKEKLPNTKTMVGGAVLTEDYAKMIGADFYGKTAMDSVRYAEKLFK